MLATLLVLWTAQPFLALMVSFAVYGVVLLLLRPLNGEELATLSPLLPARFKQSRILGRVLRGTWSK